MTPGQAAFEKWQVTQNWESVNGWEYLNEERKLAWEEIAKAAIEIRLAEIRANVTKIMLSYSEL